MIKLLLFLLLFGFPAFGDLQAQPALAAESGSAERDTLEAPRAFDIRVRIVGASWNSMGRVPRELRDVARLEAAKEFNNLRLQDELKLRAAEGANVSWPPTSVPKPLETRSRLTFEVGAWDPQSDTLRLHDLRVGLEEFVLPAVAPVDERDRNPERQLRTVLEASIVNVRLGQLTVLKTPDMLIVIEAHEAR